MNKKYVSKKDSFFYIFIGIGILAIILTLNGMNMRTNVNILSIIICLIVLIFLLSILLFTYYEIKTNKLYYRSGPISGYLLITDIYKIQTKKKLWSGFKVATSINGIVIKYNKFDEIFISPKNQEDFINALLEINSEIIIERN